MEGDVVVGHFVDAVFLLQFVRRGDEVVAEGLGGLLGRTGAFHPVVEGHVDLSCLVVGYFEFGVGD